MQRTCVSTISLQIRHFSMRERPRRTFSRKIPCRTCLITSPSLAGGKDVLPGFHRSLSTGRSKKSPRAQIRGASPHRRPLDLLTNPRILIISGYRHHLSDESICCRIFVFATVRGTAGIAWQVARRPAANDLNPAPRARSTGRKIRMTDHTESARRVRVAPPLLHVIS